MQLTVIIVSYNVRYFLEQALLSIRRAAEGISVEVFVVDNDSSDGSVDLVRQKFPEVRLIANEDNPGFAVANNQAIRLSMGKYVLLLNPDTVVEEDTFRKCIDFMEAHTEAGGLGVRMIDGSGKFLPESKRGFPSPWVAFCKTFGLSRLFPRSRVFNHYHLGFLDEFATNEVEVLAGAFMLIRRSVLDKTGLLDETFFMYGEDIDLSYRIVQAGFKNYYFPETTIIHYKGESTRKGNLNYVRIFYQAMIIFARKHFSGRQATLFVLLLQAGIYFRAIMTVAGHIFKKIWLPLADAGLIFGGLWLLKDFWATYYFSNTGYFDHPRFYFFNIPLYISVWIGGLFLSGCYDESRDLRRLFRGIFWGTLVLAAVYGFLPEDLRFSRALLLLGAIWAVLATLALRTLIHFMKYKNLEVGREQTKTLAIVGSMPESERAQKLLQQAGVQKNFIGTVAPSDPFDNNRFLGALSVLDDLVHIYRIDEVIFCSSDVTAQEIMHWMTRLSPAVEFKILPEESLSIIGSHSKNMPGELYTIDIQYRIATPMNRRNKRALDLTACILLLPALPFFLIFMKNSLSFYKNWLSVLIGKRSWVGYFDLKTEINDLPKIKPALFTPLDELKVHISDEVTIQRLNFLYAKEYTPWKDVRILTKGILKYCKPVD